MHRISTVLFAGGAYFCYYYVLPLTLGFFKAEFDSIGVTPSIRVGEYLSTALTVICAFGLVFELPLLTFFLARVGLVDHRSMIGWFKHAIVLIFFVSAILTPPDVLTQFLMAGPLLVLYVLSIGVAYFAAPAPEEPEKPAPS